jgi:hypothetical protein
MFLKRILCFHNLASSRVAEKLARDFHARQQNSTGEMFT